MANKKANTAPAKSGADIVSLHPVDITYKGIDFGTVDARRFRDQRFRTAVTRMLRAAKKGDTSAGMDNELRMYELLFGADKVDDVLDKLADANDGIVDVTDMRDFMQHIMSEAGAKNS